MNKVKFFLINLIINVIFVALMIAFFIYGVNTNNFFQVIPPTVLLVAGIGISIYNVKAKGLLTSVSELAVCALMYLAYINTINGQFDILSSNFGFVVMIRGLISLVGALVIMKACQLIILPVITYAEIYSIVNNTGVLRSFAGCIMDFDSTLLIPFFNYVVRNSFHEIFTKVKESAKGASKVNEESTDESDNNENKITDQIGGILDSLKDTKVAKASSKLLKIYSEYPDECILAYCYLYPEMPIYRAVMNGIGVFLTNAPLLLGQIAALVVMAYIVKYTIVFLLLAYIWHHGILTILNLFFYFLLIMAVQFIITNVFTNYVLMSSIVSTYITKARKDDHDYHAEVAAIFPNLNKIKRVFGIKDEDVPKTTNNETDVNNVQNEANATENEVKSGETQKNSESSQENAQNEEPVSVDDVRL